MNILVLGGTQFVGRHIVEAFLEAGHQVSILTRGKSADDLPAPVERLQGDRDQGPEGLSALTGRQWDACVDVSGYTPRQVRASAELLRDRISQYVFISTVNVYADPGRHPVREDDPLLPPAAEDVTEVTGETYGPLKVACEHIVQEVYGKRCAILRPQLVAGPYDHTARYPYWVDRASRGGEMLAPGDGSDHMQVIDARDQARFAVKIVEENIRGVFNLAGPRLSWSAFLEMLGAATVRWLSHETLQSHGLGHRELPVYVPEHSEQGGLVDVSPERALAAGLVHTAPSVTAADTHAWSRTAGLSYALTPEREKEVLNAVVRTS